MIHIALSSTIPLQAMVVVSPTGCLFYDIEYGYNIPSATSGVFSAYLFPLTKRIDSTPGGSLVVTFYPLLPQQRN